MILILPCSCLIKYPNLRFKSMEWECQTCCKAGTENLGSKSSYFFGRSNCSSSPVGGGLENEWKNRDFSADSYVWFYALCGYKTSIIYV